MSIQALTTLPNVGPAIARRLSRLGIEEPGALRGRDPEEMFDRLGKLSGHAEDPCVLDTFRAIVAHANGEPARPWWHWSRERLARGERNTRKIINPTYISLDDRDPQLPRPAIARSSMITTARTEP
jgi:hypothetical protein